MGIPCLGLSRGPAFKHNEAFSFQVATADQAETDRYGNAIVAGGGQESACGWCNDKWGLSRQITPIALTNEAVHPVHRRDISRCCTGIAAADRLLWFEWPSAWPRPVNGISLCDNIDGVL